MTDSANAIGLLFVWYLVVLFMLAGTRAYLALARGKPANSFAPGGEDLPGFGRRLTRVHANNYENLPFLLAILIYAQASGQSEVTDPLAMLLVAARVAQGATHLASVSVPAVFLRFGLFLVQIGVFAWWTVQLFFA